MKRNVTEWAILGKKVNCSLLPTFWQKLIIICGINVIFLWYIFVTKTIFEYIEVNIFISAFKSSAQKLEK